MLTKGLSFVFPGLLFLACGACVSTNLSSSSTPSVLFPFGCKSFVDLPLEEEIEWSDERYNRAQEECALIHKDFELTHVLALKKIDHLIIGDYSDYKFEQIQFADSVNYLARLQNIEAFECYYLFFSKLYESNSSLEFNSSLMEAGYLLLVNPKLKTGQLLNVELHAGRQESGIIRKFYVNSDREIYVTQFGRTEDMMYGIAKYKIKVKRGNILVSQLEVGK